MDAFEQFEHARHKLWDELVSVGDVWAQYLYLFGDSPERVEMLKACAGWFFGLTQRLLIREVILAISRLTDPVNDGRFSNLVLETLLLDPELGGRSDVKAELKHMIASVRTVARPIRSHRNKYIAHLDHATALFLPDSPLPGIKRADIDGVLVQMGDVYKLHSSRMRGTSVSL